MISAAKHLSHYDDSLWSKRMFPSDLIITEKPEAAINIIL